MKKSQLPKEFATKWLEALRSGKYKQGNNELLLDKNNNFCCIGVAAIICKIPKNKILSKKIICDTIHKQGSLPNELYPKELTYDKINPKHNLLVVNLTCKNDGVSNQKKKINMKKKQYSFPEIADWVEQNCDFY